MNARFWTGFLNKTGDFVTRIPAGNTVDHTDSPVSIRSAAAGVGSMWAGVTSIAVDDDGFICVADVGNNRIQKFAP